MTPQIPKMVDEVPFRDFHNQVKAHLPPPNLQSLRPYIEGVDEAWTPITALIEII